MKNQPISVSKAKKAIADYKKAIGRPDGMAELSIFYCEVAFSFLESCSLEDESYFAALIRMYERSLEFVSNLPPAERATYLERLDKLRSRARNIGWGVQDELNSLWYAAALDEQQTVGFAIDEGTQPCRSPDAVSPPNIERAANSSSMWRML